MSSTTATTSAMSFTNTTTNDRLVSTPTGTTTLRG
jgi:hypothetical protein